MMQKKTYPKLQTVSQNLLAQLNKHNLIHCYTIDHQKEAKPVNLEFIPIKAIFVAHPRH